MITLNFCLSNKISLYYHQIFCTVVTVHSVHSNLVKIGADVQNFQVSFPDTQIKFSVLFSKNSVKLPLSKYRLLNFGCSFFSFRYKFQIIITASTAASNNDITTILFSTYSKIPPILYIHPKII